MGVVHSWGDVALSIPEHVVTTPLCSDVADVVVTSETKSRHTGITHVYLRQRVNGIEVGLAEALDEIARDVGFLVLAGILLWRPWTRFSVDGLLMGEIDE